VVALARLLRFTEHLGLTGFIGIALVIIGVVLLHPGPGTRGPRPT
jgi:multidrug transporter EmrE-like cation transporter